jgi:hypothetical protein
LLYAAGDLQRWAANMKSIAAILIIIVAAAVTCKAEEKSVVPLQGGYSTVPLREPIFDEAQVIAETTAINEWLNTNIRKLSYEQMKRPREHLYYIINSRVKQLYATEKLVLPAKHDPILEILFYWSEPLGVFGGAYAFNAVKSPSFPPKVARMKLPEGIVLNLVNDTFTISSNLGWSITFPYYFMIWNVGDFTAKGGPRTQLVVLSTGAAKDKSQAGRSQATLMFLFSPEKHASFERYWREQMGIRADIKLKTLGVKNLQSRHVIDEATRLHKEFTAWSGPVGSFAVVYVGIEGTYEWNRPHFIDFLWATKTDGE